MWQATSGILRINNLLPLLDYPVLCSYLSAFLQGGYLLSFGRIHCNVTPADMLTAPAVGSTLGGRNYR